MRNMNNKAMMLMGLAGMMAWAAPAKAGDFALTIGIQGPHGNQLGLTIGNGCVTPVLVTQPVVVPVERVWVPPVYRDVIERVWVPTTETQYRDVPVVDAWGRVIAYRREAYTVQTGYWQDVTRRELVREGYWRIVDPCERQKSYYGIGGYEDHRGGDVRIGLHIEKNERNRGEVRHGVVMEKGPAPKPRMKVGMIAEKLAKVVNNGKLAKVGSVKKK